MRILGAIVPVILLACACGGGDTSASGGDASAGDGTLPSDGHAANDTASADAGTPPDAPADANVPTATVHFLGRFDTRDPMGPRFAWPGSAIAATFMGTGITAKLHDAGTNTFAVVVDGGKPTVLSTSNATDVYPLASSLAAGTHTLLLTKRTESFVSVVQYLGLTVAGGALVPSPEPFARRVEYVGDSISCGYGDLGVGPNCSFSVGTEDVTVAYDELASAALDAQATVIAYSGIGVLRDYSGTTTNQMPVRFELTLADDPTSTWAFATPAPDAVVVNLGTNDFAKGDPGAAFQQAYVAFVQQLRKHYASANIVCALSPMLGDPARSQARTYLQAVVSQVMGAGDAHVSYFEFDEQLASDGYGCDYHPSPTTHQKMAAKLEPVLKSLDGW
jgi:lysophospholipase L1-like esterase